MEEAAAREQVERDWQQLARDINDVKIFNTRLGSDRVSTWWYDSKLRVLTLEVDIVVPATTMMKVFPDEYVHPEEYEDGYYGTFHLEMDVTDPNIYSTCKSCIACVEQLATDKDIARYYAQLIYNERYEWVFAEPEVYGEYSATTQKGIFDAIEKACIGAWRFIQVSYRVSHFLVDDGYAGRVKAPTYELTLK